MWFNFFAPELTRPDIAVLKTLFEDIKDSQQSGATATPELDQTSNGKIDNDIQEHDVKSPPTLTYPEPTVFMRWDLQDIPPVLQAILQPYIKWAQTVVRHPTDVVMLTHLILYSCTSIPSAIYLYRHFSYIHGILHSVMQLWFAGTYTLMRHQHIHMGGILAKTPLTKFVDTVYPYITDPLHGHTWNSYYYHHVKHHHVEGNGPNDLSSTIRYQRDELSDFMRYTGKFIFRTWIDLPLYFLRRNKPGLALALALSEYSNLLAIILLARWQLAPTIFVFIVPLCLMRIGLMIGNWGQHAFVDEEEPDSDYRSSITLIDPMSNRYCFNDGYHTSHHLNSRRHWRDHPKAFVDQRDIYSSENGLVFQGIDYIMVTIRLLMKDYESLAHCLIPLGAQVNMSFEEKVQMLKSRTKAFSEEEIKEKFEKH